MSTLQEELDALQAEYQQKQRDIRKKYRDISAGRPAENTRDWFIESAGAIEDGIWSGKDVSKGRWRIGNAFKTRAEASAHLAWLRATAAVAARIRVENAKDNFVVEPDNPAQDKYLFVYNSSNNTITVMADNGLLCPVQFVGSETALTEVLADAPEEIRIMLGAPPAP